MLLCVATHVLVPTSLLTLLVDVLNAFAFLTQFIAIGLITGFEPVSPVSSPRRLSQFAHISHISLCAYVRNRTSFLPTISRILTKMDDNVFHLNSLLPNYAHSRDRKSIHADLVPQSGIEPELPAWEAGVLTIRRPGHKMCWRLLVQHHTPAQRSGSVP